MSKIQDYATIGNCRSTALVSNNGSIDWLCWPHFDSDPIFGGLLDPSQGCWSITPADSFQLTRKYAEDTYVLKTTFLTSQGQAVLTDVMPVASEEEKRNIFSPEQEILRKVECTRGQMEFKVTCSLNGNHRFYSKNKTLGIRAEINGGVVIFKSNVDLNSAESCIEDTFVIQEGKIFYFSLSFSTEAPAVVPVLDETTEEVIDRSVRWWQKFAAGISYQGPYRQAVVRSALVLKLMSHSPSGAIIASPTTSLPEKIGGDLNWDYRYCWLRDASLTTHALMSINLPDEARAFVNWLLHATNLTRPKLKVLYDVYGRNPQKEKSLPQFSGYSNSQPVRVGNQASQQDQMDIYGEVICAAVTVFSDAQQIDLDTQRMLKEFGDYICDHWDQEDAGMWEVRGKKEYYTHSLLLCWAGLNGLMELNSKGLLKKIQLDKIKTAHQRIAQSLGDLAWNEDMQTYTATLRGETVDANTLLLPRYQFIPAGSGRMQKTYQRIKEHLSSSSALLYRNHNQDEGAFILCSLWAVEYLALGGGRLEEAQELFEHVLSYANDVGLLSEELDPSTGDQLGNFPLAFSHAGVINAAVAIKKRKKQEGTMVSAEKAQV